MIRIEKGQKNQEIGQISWYLIESRECEEMKGSRMKHVTSGGAISLGR